MGFRGEAMASIASIAEVDLKTRTIDADLATHIIIRSSEIIEQNYCQAEQGTTMSVKNLFFNVPARRKFLKTDSVELKHILEEFQRVALAHHEIRFKVFHNDNEIYHLPNGTLKKRLLGIFRKTYEDKLVRIDEETDVVKISGYVGEPEIARKQKGEQYIFVNKRFIKSSYLNHAVKTAYQNLLDEKQWAFFVLFLEIDPARIDINVHPTKQEIKFDEEKVIYKYLMVAIKHGLGRYTLSPQLDFDNTLDMPAVRRQSANGNGHFEKVTPQASTIRTAPVMRNWQSLYNGLKEVNLEDDNNEEPLVLPSHASGDLLGDNIVDSEEKQPMQVHNSFIVTQIKSGIMIIDQHQAHVRILYERYLNNLENHKEHVQKQLFPITVEISKENIGIFEDIMPDLADIGFEINSFGGQTFIVQGIPAGFKENNLQSVMDNLIDSYAQNIKLKLSKNENIARSMALSAAVPKGKRLEQEEMKLLIDDLFACEMPYTGPSGRKCFITYELNDLDKLFS